jgi:hypothetical protein
VLRRGGLASSVRVTGGHAPHSTLVRAISQFVLAAVPSSSRSTTSR